MCTVDYGVTVIFLGQKKILHLLDVNDVIMSMMATINAVFHSNFHRRRIYTYCVFSFAEENLQSLSKMAL